MASCPILTYHSQLLFGHDYGNNSHVGLAADLEVIAASGRRLLSLRSLATALATGGRELDLDTAVCITFDDGPDFDWLDIDHPQLGPQPGFARLLREYSARHPDHPAACASSFVIAAAEARTAISRDAMDGHDWMHDHWWRAAEASGVLEIESHGLDHRHACLSPGDPGFGHFHAVDDEAACSAQIEFANQLIAERSGSQPRLFAYPYGQSSDYLRFEYLPRFQHRHGLLAAVSTEPGAFHWDCERWFLPRYVSLQHWHSPDDLDRLLRS